MFVCCEFCVLSVRGLCDELITRPEESYRLLCVVVRDLETSWMRRPWPTGGGGCRTKIWLITKIGTPCKTGVLKGTKNRSRHEACYLPPSNCESGISGVISPYSHIPSWRKKWEFYIFLNAFAKFAKKRTVSFVMSVRTSCVTALNNSALTERIFMKFDIWEFLENLSIKFKFHYNLTIITGTLHEDRYTFFIISR